MNLIDLSFEETKALADSVEGFSFHHMTREPKLKEDLAVYLEANPDKIPIPEYEPPENDQNPSDPNAGDQGTTPGTDPEEPPVDPETPETPENDETETGLVKIQSAYRGKIGSSFGMMDFGIDGICEVSEEAAEHICKLEGYERC